MHAHQGTLRLPCLWLIRRPWLRLVETPVSHRTLHAGSIKNGRRTLPVYLPSPTLPKQACVPACLQPLDNYMYKLFLYKQRTFTYLDLFFYFQRKTEDDAMAVTLTTYHLGFPSLSSFMVNPTNGIQAILMMVLSWLPMAILLLSPWITAWAS